jgi:hypothetical protein
MVRQSGDEATIHLLLGSRGGLSLDKFDLEADRY